MTKSKELLLKDLCARLPYGVICRYKNENRPLFCVRPTQYYKIALDNAINVKHNGVENCVIEEVKPYLFPLSSMSEEQKEEWRGIRWSKLPWDELDWLNKGHWDYRHLIEKGLAIDATGKGIY